MKNRKKKAPGATGPGMRAVTADRYGGPEVLELTTLPRPVPEPGEILLRVEAASVNSADRRIMRADPWALRLAFGLRRPRITAFGVEASGVVETVGDGVTRFKCGDILMGDLSTVGCGGYAEYVCASADRFALAPTSLPAVERGCIPIAGTTALQGLRDYGELEAGQRVLVIGANGGVGQFAVQIAGALGAHVTGACRSEKVAMVQALGAERVVATDLQDVTRSGDRFDVIFDTAAYRSVFDYERILTARGTYVLAGGAMSRLLQVNTLGALKSRTRGKRYRNFVAKHRIADLDYLRELAERGELRVTIDGTYSLDRVREAVSRAESRQAVGKVVITP